MDQPKAHSRSPERPKEHKNPIKSLVSKVHPSTLFIKDLKEPPRNPVPGQKITIADVLNKHHHVPNNRPARKRATTVSAGNLSNMSHIEYNPYGIYDHHDLLNVSSAFGNGSPVKHESERNLISPISKPNEYLCEGYRQDIENFDDKYQLMDTNIGFGGSAVIKKVSIKGNHDNGNKLYALKKFSIYWDEPQSKYYTRVATEYVITKRLKHLHTVSCYELLQLPLSMQRAWGMIMDFYGYDLFKLIKTSTWRNVPFSEKMCIFKQICFGLKFIHEQDIAHLDIKPDNVLVSKNGVMKITDYGCAEYGHEQYGNFKSRIAYKLKKLGTPPYQPPEVAIYKHVSTDKRSAYCPFKFDYWSLGICLFTIVMGKLPFAESIDTDANYKVYLTEFYKFVELNPLFYLDNNSRVPKKGIFSDSHGYDSNFIYLFWRLCDPNPKTRMSLRQLFHNKFFQKLEMCLDEKDYECNFVNHKIGKSMQFKVSLDSNEEFSVQKEIKHSLWEDIPTTSDSSKYKYTSLVDRSPKLTGSSPTDHDMHKFGKEKLPVHEIESPESALSSSSMKQSNEKLDHSLVYPHPHENISRVRSLHSVLAGTATDNFRLLKFLSKDDETDDSCLFDESDYSTRSDSTEFMVVVADDLLKACSCPVAPHSHNSLYSYKELRGKSIS